jgi:hypothetical protein
VEHTLRSWTCEKCGRANETVVALDGHARCAFCQSKTRIQASRDYLSVLSSRHPELPPDDAGQDEDELPLW